MTIIDVMHVLQAKQGWSQNELGRQLQLPQGQVSDILKGKRPITFKLVHRLHELGAGSIEKLHHLALDHETAREESKFSARIQRATAHVATSIALVLATFLIAATALIPEPAQAKTTGSIWTLSASFFRRSASPFRPRRRSSRRNPGEPAT